MDREKRGERREERGEKGEEKGEKGEEKEGKRENRGREERSIKEGGGRDEGAKEMVERRRWTSASGEFNTHSHLQKGLLHNILLGGRDILSGNNGGLAAILKHLG